MMWAWALRNPLMTAGWALAVLLLVAAGVQSVRLSAAEATLARERQAWAQERLAAAMAESETVQEYRRREQELQAQANEAERRLEDERRLVAGRDARIALLLRDNRGLREHADRLAAYAAGPPEDSVAACQARASALAAHAAALGDRATSIGILARQAAAERDEFGAQVVACVTAWPG